MVFHSSLANSVEENDGGAVFSRKDAILKFINDSWIEEAKGFASEPIPKQEHLDFERKNLASLSETAGFINSLVLLDATDFIYPEVAEFVDATYKEGRGYTSDLSFSEEGLIYSFYGINILTHLHSLHLTSIPVRQGAIDYIVNSFNESVGAFASSATCSVYGIYFTFLGYYALKFTNSLHRINLDSLKDYVAEFDPYTPNPCKIPLRTVGQYITLLHELELFESVKEQLEPFLDLLESDEFWNPNGHFGFDATDNYAGLLIFHSFNNLHFLNSSFFVDWILSKQQPTGYLQKDDYSTDVPSSSQLEAHLLSLILLNSLDILDDPFPYNYPWTYWWENIPKTISSTPYIPSILFILSIVVVFRKLLKQCSFHAP